MKLKTWGICMVKVPWITHVIVEIQNLIVALSYGVVRIVNLDILIIPLVCSQILLYVAHSSLVYRCDQTITFYSKHHPVYVIKKVSM